MRARGLLRHAAREDAEAVVLPSTRCHEAPSPFVIDMTACASTSGRDNHATSPSQDQISAASDHGVRRANHQPEDSADLVSRIGVVRQLATRVRSHWSLRSVVASL